MNARNPGASPRIFEPLARAWKDGDEALRAEACLELRNLSGAPLGGNRSGQETDLLLFGDGTLHYFRRGDFGERGGKPPGQWRGACEPSVADALWKALEPLTEADFRGRAADPGEAVTHLQARCGGFAACLTWGPAEMGRDRPGVDALGPLRMLVSQAQQETVWTLSLLPGPVRRGPEGLVLPLSFSNGGPQPVRLLVGPPGLGAEFSFRYAVDESDDSGEPPLQINWEDARVSLSGETSLRIADVFEGGNADLLLTVEGKFPPGGRYLGHVTYRQLDLGERLAGLGIFHGMAFTDIFKFST